MFEFLFQSLLAVVLCAITVAIFDIIAARKKRAEVAPEESAQQRQQNNTAEKAQSASKSGVKHNTDAAASNKQEKKKKAAATGQEMVTEAPAVEATTAFQSTEAVSTPATSSKGPKILIAYASNSQNCLTLSHKLFNLLNVALRTTAATTATTTTIVPAVKVLELRQEDSNACSVDTLLEDKSYALVIFVVSTFSGGVAPPRSQAFEQLLRDAFEDHRVPRDALAHKRFAVFGLGDPAYGEADFNAFAKHLNEWCRGLGAPSFVVPPVYATDRKAQALFQVFTTALLKWVSRAEFGTDGSLRLRSRGAAAAGKSKGEKAASTVASSEACCCCQGEGNGENGGACCNSSASPSGENGEGAALAGASQCGCGNKKFNGGGTAYVDSEEDEGDSNNNEDEDDNVDDVEDLVWDGQDDENDDDPSNLPELLYPKLRENLTKQGYHLIGSHSGVKLCRWTKSMLRGRGGCYKHTFYNINSSQCMEMTPSLACANKCVFCWRHHTNPVSRNFRWKQDPPELLVAQGMEGHRKMLKQLRGVPGVTPERLAEAMNIRHCALSLVGEPIMYPQINEFVDLLHDNHISSFMVTNAQFPDQLRDLKPVVQLYLSIDAPTAEQLKRIDRPLFEDYWERCLSCVRELRKKRQRTVFRLTLVNEYNEDNIAAYADLVEMGWPDFIEVKGVTYCGTSNSSTLTMKDNVPRHDEVITFCKALCAEVASRHTNYEAATMKRTAVAPTTAEADGASDDDVAVVTEKGEGGADVVEIPDEERNRPYHIACEHEHSCCVLIALDKFYFNRRWHTWIDYEEFYRLVESGKTDFTSLDYAAPTPAWATYNSEERGFDPEQTRVLRKNARPVVITSGC